MTTIQPRRFASTAEFDTALTERLEAAIGRCAAGGSALMLSGGRTPLPAYRQLAARRPRPAAGLRLLYSDERHVPIASESSNFHQSLPLIEALGLPDSAVLRVRTELSLEQAAADYGHALGAMLGSGVRIGLGLLGLGTDGHTASLFNLSSLEQGRGRLAIAVQRPDGLQGISVTPDLLSRVEQPLFLVSGAEKQEATARFLRGDPELIALRAVAGCPTVEIWIAP
jgi:6-phosphogluconolactonase